MTINVNPKSGIAYGYISAACLDSDLVCELQDNGTDVHYAVALEEARKTLAGTEEVQRDACGDADLNFEGMDEDDRYRTALQYVNDNWYEFEQEFEQEFNDSYQPDESIHEGTKDGVKYRTSWLGGALNVWIFESPFVTHLARRASPCVPNSGILDVLDGNVTAYDVPPEWRDNQG